MRIFFIRKANGKKRVIYAPSEELKTELRELLPILAEKAKAADVYSVCHGFVKGRSPVTNARRHRGFTYTVCFDLEDFFDSVKRQDFRLGRSYLGEEIMDKVFYDGAPRQGLPTSPAVANLAASRLDRDIVKTLRGFNIASAYTRYADDLSISYDQSDFTKILLDVIPLLVRNRGFRVNPSKTRVMCSKQGRRIITGVAVDTRVHPPRRVRRRLRAAIHQGNKSQIKGLKEWCCLKLPNTAYAPTSAVYNEKETLRSIIPDNQEIFGLDLG